MIFNGDNSPRNWAHSEKNSKRVVIFFKFINIKVLQVFCRTFMLIKRPNNHTKLNLF